MSSTIVFRNMLVKSLDLKRIRHIGLVSDDGVHTSVRIGGRDKHHLDELQAEIDKVNALVGKKVDVEVKEQQWRVGTRSGTLYYLVDITEI